MKLLKYTILIAALCTGLSSLARANVNDLGEVTLVDNGDQTELDGFIALAPEHADAEICFKSKESGLTTGTFAGGSITIALNLDDTIHVTWDMSATGGVVCGFLTKDGGGNLVHYYSVDTDQGTIGSADLEVPANGGDSLSHLTVFCCPGGVTTPDSGTTAMLLGGALTGLGVVRRYMKR